MLGGRSAVKKVCEDFFDKLKGRRNLLRPLTFSPKYLIIL